MNFNKKTDLLSLSLILAIFCAVAAALLAWVADVTRPAIEAAELRTQNQSLEKLLPAAANLPSQCMTECEGVRFYGAFDAAGALLGVAGYATGNGYGGELQVYAGLTPEGAVREVAEGRSAVLVTKHTETPGLGSIVAERKTQKTLSNLFDEAEAMPANSILDGFAGQNAAQGEWKVQKDGGSFAFRTGATVTSRAVTSIVFKIADTYLRNRDQIVQELIQRNGVK